MCGTGKRYMIDVSRLSGIIASCDDSVRASFMRRCGRPSAGAMSSMQKCVRSISREGSLHTVEWRYFSRGLYNTSELTAIGFWL